MRRVNGAKLRVTCGMPGAGKSSWAARQDGLVLSADIIRTQPQVSAALVFESLYARCRAGLRDGLTVIIDTCALRACDRLTLRRLAQETRAVTEVVVFTTPWHECRARDQRRGMLASSVLWSEMQQRMADSMRAIPTEPWDARSFVPYARRVSEVCWSKPVLQSP